MSVSITDAAVVPAATATRPWPIRVRPALIVLAAVGFLMVVPGYFFPRTQLHFAALFGGPAVGAILIAGWWAFRSRVRGWDRAIVPILLFGPALLLATTLFRGVPAMSVPLYFLPAVSALTVAWLAVTPALARGPRRAGLVAVALLGWAACGLARMDGIDGDLVPAFRWCWQPSAEERFRAERGEPAGPAPSTGEIQAATGDWPGFRGPDRDGRATGTAVDPDWAKHPPRLLWKHRVGPGWGSFAAVGGRLFTQEQVGPDEAIVCYAAETGEKVWEHLEPGRFDEAMGGVGPRATPTFHEGRLYAQGATGTLLCLDAATGTKLWAADVRDGTGGKVPQWGYSGSPLVIRGVVVVYAGGPDGKGTAAYRADGGQLAWAAGKASHCYTSAQRATFGGVEQVLMPSDYGVESFRPDDGAPLWEYAWPLGKGLNRVTQAAVLNDTDFALTTGVGGDQGIRRVRVSKAGDGWDVKAVWASKAVKPYYNDGVVFGDHYYGFDGDRFCCVDLADGRQKWKEGTYGHGQVLLLADQGLLLVQAVDGAVALVEANPADFNELGKFAAIAGKTWNHPVLVRGKLFVRNASEAACYELKAK